MEKIKQKIYLNRLRENLGRIKEYEDKIVCYVQKEKLNKFEDKRWYHFVFNENKLDKPLHIIFEKINFNPYKNIIIDSCDGIHFTFRKCLFEGQIDIGYAESMHLENNYYFHDVPFTNFQYFFKGRIKNLKITNDNFCMCELVTPVPYLFFLELDNLEIKNTSMMLPNCNGIINMRANKIDVINSHIKTNNSVKLLANQVNLNNSKIESQKEVVIIGKYKGNLKEQLNTPRINHNGIDVTNEIFGNIRLKQLIKK